MTAVLRLCAIAALIAGGLAAAPALAGSDVVSIRRGPAPIEPPTPQALYDDGYVDGYLDGRDDARAERRTRTPRVDRQARLTQGRWVGGYWRDGAWVPRRWIPARERTIAAGH